MSLLFASCTHLFFQPASQELFRLDPQKVVFRDVFIPIQGQAPVHARIFSAPDSIAKKGLILHFHGNAENLSTHFFAFYWAVQKGYDYVIWDYPGYWQSIGTPSVEAATSAGTQVLQWVSDSLLQDSSRFVVVGQSLGGALAPVSVANWKGKDRVDAIVLDATFDRYPTEARRVLAEHPVTWLFQPFGWLLVSGQYNPEKYYSQLPKSPILVTHCQDDIVVPSQFALEILQKVKGPKELWLSDTCGHIGFFHRGKDRPRERLMQLLDDIKRK